MMGHKSFSSGVVAIALWSAAMAPLPAVAMLTTKDLEAVEKIVMTSEARMDLKFKDIDLRFKEQANMFVLVPVVATGISGITVVIAAGISADTVSKSNNKLDLVIARFTNETDIIQRNLEAGTEAKALQGTITGVVVGILLVSGIAKFLI